MEIPKQLVEDLKKVRRNFELRLNPKAVCVNAAHIDACGLKRGDAVFDPRFELWDKDPYGKEYKVMTVQESDGSFRFPDQRLVDHLNKVNPEHYGGNLHAMVAALIDDPEALRELGTKKDTDELIDSVAKWAEWCETPKSGSALSKRGRRLLSG